MIDAPAAGSARSAGLLLPLFSMPSSRSWGIGEFADLPAVARWMQGAGLRLLQLLPLNEMAPGQSSPYSAISAMALDPIFITAADVPDFQALGGDGDGRGNARDAGPRAQKPRCGLPRRPLAQGSGAEGRVPPVSPAGMDDETPREPASCRTSSADESWWLDDYALFRAAHHATDGRAWREWPAELRNHRAGGMDRLRRELGLDILFRQYLQWIAQAQWRDARTAARA